jgi:hypothetical protein
LRVTFQPSFNVHAHCRLYAHFDFSLCRQILFLEIKEKASVYLGKTYFTVLATTSEDPNMDQLLKKKRRRRNK